MTFPAGAPSSNLCPNENFRIRMGDFTLSDGYNEGSVLRYSCPEGYYSTLKTRHCKNGSWKPKPKIRPECKSKQCTMTLYLCLYSSFCNLFMFITSYICDFNTTPKTVMLHFSLNVS